MSGDQIIKVEKYVTPDGESYDTLADAEKALEKAQMKARLIEKLDCDIYCRDTSAEEIVDWIFGNLNFTIKS